MPRDRVAQEDQGLELFRGNYQLLILPSSEGYQRGFSVLYRRTVDVHPLGRGQVNRRYDLLGGVV